MSSMRGTALPLKTRPMATAVWMLNDHRQRLYKESVLVPSIFLSNDNIPMSKLGYAFYVPIPPTYRRRICVIQRLRIFHCTLSVCLVYYIVMSSRKIKWIVTINIYYFDA